MSPCVSLVLIVLVAFINEDDSSNYHTAAKFGRCVSKGIIDVLNITTVSVVFQDYKWQLQAAFFQLGQCP